MDGSEGGAPGGGGAHAVSAAVSVDVPFAIFHYVDVNLNGKRYFVNYNYSLCRTWLKPS